MLLGIIETPPVIILSYCDSTGHWSRSLTLGANSLPVMESSSCYADFLRWAGYCGITLGTCTSTSNHHVEMNSESGSIAKCSLARYVCYIRRNPTEHRCFKALNVWTIRGRKFQVTEIAVVSCIQSRDYRLTTTVIM